MKILKGALKIKKPESASPGSWGINTRKRKGLHYSADFYNGTQVGVGLDRYVDRVLSDSDLWTVYRRCSDVRACIDSIVRRVATFDWMVVPKVSPQNEEYKELQDICSMVEAFLHRPNRNGDTWQEIMTAMLTDCLCFDSGVFELVYDRKGNLQELVPLRGSTIQPVIDSLGRLQYYEQNIYEENTYFTMPSPDADNPPKFKAKQIMYLSIYKNTALPNGNPIIESLVNEVIALMRATQNAMLTLDADEVPPGILVLAGIAGKAAEEAKADLQRLKGQDHKVRVMTTPDPTGIGARWLELKKTPKDIQMHEIVEDIRKVIYRAFGVMPVEMGMTQGLQRSTATVQMDVASSHLVTPLLELIQAKINAQIIPAVLKSKDVADLIEFRFDRESRLSPDDQNKLSGTYRNYVSQGIMTRNEVRESLGFLPVEGGDVPTVEVAGMPQPLAHVIQGFEHSNFITDDQELEIDETLQDMEEYVPPEDFGNENPDEYIILASKKDRLAVKSNAKEAMEALNKKTQKALKKKGKEHNEKYGSDPKKKLPNVNYLAVCYWRGIGAYKGNPESVRPVVVSAEQWAYARVNGLLYALRTGKFKNKKPFDTDLLPKEHRYYGKESRDLTDRDLALPEFLNSINITVKNGKYFIDGKRYEELELPRGYTYIFLQDDESNKNHPMRFSLKKDGTHSGGKEYTEGVLIEETAGEEGSYIQLITSSKTPNILFYYCKNHPNMGALIKFTGDILNSENDDELNTRSVSRYNPNIPKADVQEAWGWEAGAKNEVLEQGWDVFRKAHAWYDSENPESLSSYRLPIAKMIDGELKIVFRGVASAMGALKGNKKQSMEGIKAEEKQAIYNLLVKYYKDFNIEPPTLENRSIFGYYEKPEEASDELKELLSLETPKKFDIDFPNVPYPSDQNTIEELDFLIKLSKEDRQKELEFIKKADDDFALLFIELLKANNIRVSQSLSEKIYELVFESVIPIMKLKYHYNRPRPYQVAKILEIDFNVLNSETAHTPSYPSGHTVQSYLLADYLSMKYPELKSKLFKLADNISYSRMLGGYHFYSDLVFGRKIYKLMAPALRKAEFHILAVGDIDPTNFPKRGDDKKVSLKNSNHKLFPLRYAQELKEEYPEIWKLGGNIRGNHQYEILTRIQKENNGVPKTVNQEAAIRRREAWIARHFEDFRIAGVIAQVKWLAIGSRGFNYMVDLIEEEKKKVDEKKSKN